MSVTKNISNNHQNDSRIKYPEHVSLFFKTNVDKKIDRHDDREQTNEVLMEIVVWLTIICLIFLRL
jgi:hypothetical protein